MRIFYIMPPGFIFTETIAPAASKVAHHFPGPGFISGKVFFDGPKHLAQEGFADDGVLGNKRKFVVWFLLEKLFVSFKVRRMAFGCFGKKHAALFVKKLKR